MKSVIWHFCADPQGAAHQGLCFTGFPRYLLSARGLSSRLKTQVKRGKTCVSYQFLRPSPRYSGCQPAPARWTNAPRNASVLVRLLARLARHCWLAIRSKAPLSVALLVGSPAKTDTFGNSSFVKPLNSFISPLLGPLRTRERGLFSCLIGMKTRQIFRNSPIEGTAHV